MAFENHDVVIDSPVNNFAVLNALHPNTGTLSDGNLSSDTGNVKNHSSMFLPKSGVYYAEFFVRQMGYPIMGIWNHNDQTYCGYYSTVQPNESIKIKSVDVGNEFTIQSTDIVSCVVDVTGGTIQWFKNGDLAGNTPGMTSVYNVNDLSICDYSFVFWHASGGGSSSVTMNFGQDATFSSEKTPPSLGPYSDGNGIGQFYYDPPTVNGQKALSLCSKNIPSGPINVHQDDLPSDYFRALTWTGDHGGQRNIPHYMPEAPDLVWIKNRSSGGFGHTIFDSVRGYGANELQSSGNSEQGAYSGTYGYVASVDDTNINTTDGTSAGYDDRAYTNYNGHDYVAWTWRAAGSPASNEVKIVEEDGTLTTTPANTFSSNLGANIYPNKISANRKSGFSIIQYDGTAGDGHTCPHGLSSPVEMCIVKCTTTSGRAWFVYHKDLSNDSNVQLSSYDGERHTSTIWGGEVGVPDGNFIRFLRGTGASGTPVYGNVNNTGDTYISYCWHSVPGYSKIGSFTPMNAGTDSSFVHLGFRPAFIIFKQLTGGGNSYHSWLILDNARNTHNPQTMKHSLFADMPDVEGNRGNGGGSTEHDLLDFLSNGFKVKGDYAEISGFQSGKTIFMAFAENSFNAPVTAR